jgi:ATP-dependent DNA helicase DinG
LLADLALRESGFAEVLPIADYIIFDEAHQLPELAAGFFGTSISSRQLIGLVNDCRLACHNDAADVSGVEELLDTINVSIKQARLAFGTGDARLAWRDVAVQAPVARALDNLNRQLSELEKTLDELSERSRSLENCWLRCSQLLGLLQAFPERESDDSIQWLELRGQGFLLHRTPLDVSGIFQARLAQHGCECIYTSATLAVDGDFSHFCAQLGLRDIPARSWSSPFDFRSQALLYLPGNMPGPLTSGYTRTVIDAARPVIVASQGHAFLLFTSHRALQEAAAYLRQCIEYPILVQGDAPRSELLAVFRATANAVLLGTSSFWEGVDVKGQALSCVIIDKLPFAPPDDPVFRARSARMEEQGLNPFMDYQLPQAVISLKQGIGRLIRDPLDYGVLMICDPRINSRPYGRIFKRSLPDMPHTNDLEAVETFFRERQSAAIKTVSY